MATKTTRLLVLTLAATTLLAARARDSKAAFPINSPWGPGTPVHLIIGNSEGQPIIMWENKSTGQCATTVLGDASGLARSYNIVTSAANDDVWKPSTNWFTSECGGVAGSPLSYNGYYLDVFLGGGNDQTSFGPGDTYTLGESGNDDLSSAEPNALIAGGDGNDTLMARGSGFSQMLYGQGGDDCLSDDNSAAIAFDCGDGRDGYAGTPSNAVNCEESRDSCH